MKGFFKKLFSSEPSYEDNEYNLAWRNRYLEARKKHLTEKIKKSGAIPPSHPNLPTDLAERNTMLVEIIENLENALNL